MLKEVRDRLQFTINSIFDLYREHRKKLYSLSFSLVTFWAVFCSTISLLVCLAYGFFFDSYGSSILDILNSRSPMFALWNGGVSSTATLTYGLFAVFLSAYIENPVRKPGVKVFLQTVGGKNIWIFFVFMAGLLLFQLISSYDFTLRNRDYYGNPTWYDEGPGIGSFIIQKFWSLIVSVTPYACASIYIYISVKKEKRNSNLKVAICASVIACFGIDLFTTAIVQFIKTNVVDLLVSSVPSFSILFPLAFVFFIYVMIGVFFYLASAAALYFPLTNCEKIKTPEEINLPGSSEKNNSF